MARQSGIIKLKGTIGDITFYKSQDGYLARQKGGVDKDRFLNDPKFQRTRENAEILVGQVRQVNRYVRLFVLC